MPKPGTPSRVVHVHTLTVLVFSGNTNEEQTGLTMPRCILTFKREKGNATHDGGRNGHRGSIA